MANRRHVWVVWMHNNTDSRDDEPIKVWATSRSEANEIAAGHQPHRFSVGRAYSGVAEFLRSHSDWRGLTKGLTEYR